MDIRKLQRAIVDGLEDVKGQNIQVFNTEHLSPLFERVIVASGTSNRQTRALASSVREAVKKAGLDVLRTEGEDNGEWIIVDCGAAVVHLMQPQIREYYHLEEIWGEKAVRLKAAAPRGLPKASEPADAVAPRRKKAGTSAPSRRSGSAAEALKNQPVADRPNRATRIAVAKGEVERSAPKKQRVGSSSPARAAKAAAAAAAAPARKAAPRKAAVGAKPTAAKRAAPASAAKRAAPASAAKRSAPAKRAAPAAAPAKRAAPAAAPAQRAAPAKKRAAPAAAPAKRAAPVAKTAVTRKAAPKKKA